MVIQKQALLQRIPKVPRRNIPSWREFEKLIARVEEALLQSGATVKSPDRIRSLLTGRLREVDASIRAKVGSVEVLVTIECRRRGAAQDVTWLEQLQTKKQAIGAARTIAVSSSKFSEDAIRVATHYGIDLRLASEIDEQEMHRWFFPVSVTHLYKGFELHEPPHIEVDASAVRVLSKELVAEGSVSPDTSLFIVGDTGKSVSLNEIWVQAQNVLDIYKDVPIDGTKVNRRLTLAIEGDIRLLTEHGSLPVRNITLKGAFFWLHEEIPLSQAMIVQYAQPGERDVPRLARAEFVTKDAPTNNIRFGFQVAEGASNATLSVQLLPAEK